MSGGICISVACLPDLRAVMMMVVMVMMVLGGECRQGCA
jgi:hypothetical protein